MEVIDIPYSPDDPRGWKVPIPGDGEKKFSSREEALAFALRVAREEHMATAQPRYLCVEGGDGKWRLFTTDLLPLT